MIKIFETNDSNLLANLNEEIQTLHHTIQPKIFKPYNPESITTYFKTIFSEENVTAFIAKEDEKAVGYALLFVTNFADNPFQYSRRFVLIDQILVLKNYQEKGIGKLLLEATYSFAKKNKIDTVELNHWTLNESARRFFNKNKFEYYNEKMWKTID